MKEKRRTVRVDAEYLEHLLMLAEIAVERTPDETTWAFVQDTRASIVPHETVDESLGTVRVDAACFKEAMGCLVRVPSRRSSDVVFQKRCLEAAKQCRNSIVPHETEVSPCPKCKGTGTYTAYDACDTHEVVCGCRKG